MNPALREPAKEAWSEQPFWYEYVDDSGNPANYITGAFADSDPLVDVLEEILNSDETLSVDEALETLQLMTTNVDLFTPGTQYMLELSNGRLYYGMV